MTNAQIKPQEFYEKHEGAFIERWKSFLRFKSVSADSAFHKDCLECAEWFKGELESLGVTAELLTTATLPVVYGELKGDPNKPVVLFYGHYDVQPPDPLDLWKTPPFEPTVREGKMYARGAEDNKGQVSYFLCALQALRELKVSLPTIKFLIEGEEESGSDALHANLDKWATMLKADIMMVCDTGMIMPDTPTVTMGLRGIAAVEIKAHGPISDLHSGVFGGVVLNPIQALTRLVVKCHNDDGSVAIPGFYDGVTTPHKDDRDLANSAPLPYEAIEQKLGVKLRGGEQALPLMERRGFRPTLEFNGISGGYQGEGGKTVIPSFASVKISTRLVAGQDPDKVIDRVAKFFEQEVPEGIRIEVLGRSVGGPALQLSTQSEVIKRVGKVLHEAFNKEPVYMWEGASIPIITKLWQVSKAEPVLVGFGLDEDQIHAPNESFSMKQFYMGYTYVTAFLQAL